MGLVSAESLVIINIKFKLVHFKKTYSYWANLGWKIKLYPGILGMNRLTFVIQLLLQNRSANIGKHNNNSQYFSKSSNLVVLFDCMRNVLKLSENILLKLIDWWLKGNEYWWLKVLASTNLAATIDFFDLPFLCIRSFVFTAKFKKFWCFYCPMG